MPPLTKRGFDRWVVEAQDPGSEMVPAPAASLAPLALKPLDKERRRPSGDFNSDEALGLFAGLNLLPKQSFAADSSYRPSRDQQQILLQGGGRALAPVMSPGASGSALDFPPLPSRGEPSGLDRHYLPRRGVAGPSVLSSLAPEQESRCRCSPNTDPTRADRNGELRRCVESWPTITDPDPQGLSFDSTPIDSPERSRVDRRKIHFITLRRRGAALPRRLERRPASDGKEAVIDPPKRRHQPIRSRDETVRRRGDDGPIRPIAVAGLGRDQPTLFLSQHCEATPRERIIRDAGRHRVEDGLGRGVNSFPLDCLASEGRLNVDRDAALTVLAHGCSRGLASRRRGFEEAAPPPLDRRFVATGGTVQIPGDGITVPFERRSHTPILREAALDREPIPVPWRGKRRLGFTFR